MRLFRIAVLVAAFGAALFISGRPIRAADATIPIYFQDSRLLLKADVINRTLYVPIREIIAHVGLPFTDSLTLETLTIRQGNNQLVVTRNSALISYNGQIILLPSPMLREDNRWLAPVEFLTMGLTRMTNIDFRYRPGSSRIFAGNFATPELEMNAQTLGPITRLTLRCEMPIKLDVKREDPTKAILAISRTPLDPVRERLDHRDRLLRSVAFDDSDGESKLALDITRDVADVRVTSTDNNKIFFVDLLRRGEPISAAPPPTEPATTAATKPDAIGADRRVRVIVIDPGHGGMDNGVRTSAAIEKDLTLTWARRLRSALQMQLGATVLLTRDSDVAMDNEARSDCRQQQSGESVYQPACGLLEQQSGLELFDFRDEGCRNPVANLGRRSTLPALVSRPQDSATEQRRCSRRSSRRGIEGTSGLEDYGPICAVGGIEQRNDAFSTG